MIKKLLPIVLLIIGTGAGVGAGIFLRPPPIESVAENTAQSDEQVEGKDAQIIETGPLNKEYVKLSNQFVVPIVNQGRVNALVVMALSVEVPEGQKDTVFKKEPKLRDAFLQVLFDHANIGGFDGAFTDANIMAVLRSSLKEMGQKVLGRDQVSDVLITEIARQDY